LAIEALTMPSNAPFQGRFFFGCFAAFMALICSSNLRWGRLTWRDAQPWQAALCLMCINRGHVLKIFLQGKSLQASPSQGFVSAYF
jgi:hypothetical protein